MITQFKIFEMKSISNNNLLKINSDELYFNILNLCNESLEKREKLVAELKKYFDIDIHVKDYILRSISDIKGYAYILSVNIYESIGNAGLIRLTIKFNRNGYTNIENLPITNITIDEFLKIGLENLEEYFEIKKSLNKYNI